MSPLPLADQPGGSEANAFVLDLQRSEQVENELDSSLLVCEQDEHQQQHQDNVSIDTTVDNFIDIQRQYADQLEIETLIRSCKDTLLYLTTFNLRNPQTTLKSLKYSDVKLGEMESMVQNLQTQLAVQSQEYAHLFAQHTLDRDEWKQHLDQQRKQRYELEDRLQNQILQQESVHLSHEKELCNLRLGFEKQAQDQQNEMINEFTREKLVWIEAFNQEKKAELAREKLVWIEAFNQEKEAEFAREKLAWIESFNQEKEAELIQEKAAWVLIFNQEKETELTRLMAAFNQEKEIELARLMTAFNQEKETIVAAFNHEKETEMAKEKLALMASFMKEKEVICDQLKELDERLKESECEKQVQSQMNHNLACELNRVQSLLLEKDIPTMDSSFCHFGQEEDQHEEEGVFAPSFLSQKEEDGHELDTLRESGSLLLIGALNRWPEWIESYSLLRGDEETGTKQNRRLFLLFCSTLCCLVVGLAIHYFFVIG